MAILIPLNNNMNPKSVEPIAPTDLPDTPEQASGGMSQDEVQEIIRIMTEYFTRENGGDAKKAEEDVGKIAKLITHQAAKLVHLGNTVFLVLVKGKGRVEFHTMSVDDDSMSLAKNFVDLMKYLKNIGVKEAYSFSDDPKFEVVAKRTRLPYTTHREKVKGKEQTIYTVNVKEV